MKYGNERASNKDNMEVKILEGNIWAFIHMIIMVGSAICSIFVLIEEEEKGVDSKFKTFILFITVTSFVFLIFGGYKCEKSTWNYPNKPYSTEYIASLNDSNMVNGRFYLRRGYIEENLYYQYMVKLNGGFVANKVKSNNATLYYSDDNFRVEWYEKERHWLWFQQKETYNKIYIPNGSMSEEYSVNLE
jgi:hypothetical protein